MRFACQSCGKAYNLPEERIAEKSNVKLKCRVCGAIVEVKRNGDVVAQILTDVENRRGGRVSEAPAPLASMSPDDPEDATAAIAIGDGGMPAELGLPPFPPPPATGFPIPPLPPPPRVEAAAPQLRSEPPLAPPLPPPGAMISSLPPPPLASDAAMDMPVMNGSSMSNGSPSPAGAFGGSALTGSSLGGPNLGSPNMNGMHAPFGHAPMPLDGIEGELEEAEAAAALPNTATLSNAGVVSNLGGGAAAVTMTSLDSPDAPNVRAGTDHTRMKMFAAFLTGILVDRLIAGLAAFF